ncbi:hypothetical protein JTB14_022208 [Gonioctena quinquepunctata]|nr:hypothetical protein JTB14_022208 [Gonioctena quinquepunctata]
MRRLKEHLQIRNREVTKSRHITWDNESCENIENMGRTSALGKSPQEKSQNERGKKTPEIGDTRRDSKLYCRLDYDRLFIKKCLGCSERVSPEELEMRASDNIFHLRCFVCVVCGIRLQKGDLYVIKQGQPFCRTDYEKEVEMMQGFGYGEFICDDLLPASRSHDGRRGPKRRTILTTQQRRAFKASFEVSPKPCRKARQDNKASKDLENDEKKLNVKEEEQSPRSTPFFNDSCSDTETTTDETILQNTPNPHYLHIKEELENDNPFFKSNNNMPLHAFTGIEENKRREEGYVGISFPTNLETEQQTLFLNNYYK